MGFEFIRRPEVTVRHWPRALGSNMNAKTWLVEPDPESGIVGIVDPKCN